MSSLTGQFDLLLAIFSDCGIADLAKSRITPLLEQERVGLWRASIVQRLSSGKKGWGRAILVFQGVVHHASCKGALLRAALGQQMELALAPAAMKVTGRVLRRAQKGKGEIQ